jgi:hypothetical protein
LDWSRIVNDKLILGIKQALKSVLLVPLILTSLCAARTHDGIRRARVPRQRMPPQRTVAKPVDDGPSAIESPYGRQEAMLTHDVEIGLEDQRLRE